MPWWMLCGIKIGDMYITPNNKQVLVKIYNHWGSADGDTLVLELGKMYHVRTMQGTSTHAKLCGWNNYKGRMPKVLQFEAANTVFPYRCRKDGQFFGITPSPDGQIATNWY